MSKEELSPAEALRNRFREELKKPVRERFFSEEELLCVFDTAGDVYDDYLRMEVLVMGARLYPESVPLIERRAIFYIDTDDEMFTEFMKDVADIDSPMLTILRLNLLEGRPQQEIAEIVGKTVENLSLKEDEEVIQLVQTLHSLKMDRWLADNLEYLKKKVEYLPSLLYEYASLSDESTVLAEISVGVLEELTEIDPYVADYWTLLSVAYTREDKQDEAMTAVEYALAIDPDNYQALKAKLHLQNLKGDVDGQYDVVKKLLEILPTDTEVVSIGVLAGATKDAATCREFIDSLVPEAKSNHLVITNAILIDYPDLIGLLRDAYQYGLRDAETWREFADFAYDMGKLTMVNDIIRTYNEMSGDALSHDLLMFRMLFDSENYALAIRVFSEADKSGTLRRAENMYAVYSMYLVCLLRMGEKEAARDAALYMRDLLKDSGNMPGSAIERRMMGEYVDDILSRLDSKRKTNWNKYNPLPGN